MLHAVIIEDEQDAQSLLSSIINEYCPKVKLLGIAGTIEKGIELIENKKPDLLFLDIELEDGKSFEILEQIDYSSLKIIFTTAYDHFALDAFKYEAIDYLLKPYSPKDVLQAIERVKRHQFDTTIFNRLDYLLKQNNTNGKLNLPTINGINIVSISDIIRIEADRSYCSVYLSDGERIFVSKPLKEMEEKLSSNGFFRVHSANLINLNYIKKFIKDDGGYVVMNDGSQVPIARRRKQEFLDVLSQ